MTKRNIDPVKEKNEWITYSLLYFFIALFLLKTAFGIICASKSLLVSGLFSLFGIFTASVTLTRIQTAYTKPRARVYFNQGKIEFIIILCMSIIIALSAGALIFSIAHMVFSHTIYPPEFLAAWIATFAASLDFCLIIWIRKRITGIHKSDEKEIIFALDTDFALSIMAALAVIISRMGLNIADCVCAIFMAFFILIYSISFFHMALKGLMDAACDKKTVASVEEIIRKAHPCAALKTLRVNKVGHIFEIIAVIAVSGDTPMHKTADIVVCIKDALRNDFPKPSEAFVGIKSLVK